MKENENEKEKKKETSLCPVISTRRKKGDEDTKKGGK